MNFLQISHSLGLHGTLGELCLWAGVSVTVVGVNRNMRIKNTYLKTGENVHPQVLKKEQFLRGYEFCVCDN